MFKIYRQSETALKKCSSKFFDHKKDVTAKLKHLKYIKGKSLCSVAVIGKVIAFK